MARLTDDPNDPELTRGADSEPVGQAPVYLVLSEEERAKGFIRPLRRAYTHVAGNDPCHASTRMSLPSCETYARNPNFYGATYCIGCGMHRDVSEFTWDEDGAVVGS